MATKPSDWLSGLFGFALMVAYWPGISGVATTARWDVAATLAIALFFAPRVRMTAAHWSGLLLIGWLFLSLSWNDGGADGRLDGVNLVFEITVTAIAFAVGSMMTDMRSLFIGAAIGLGINSVFAIAQSLGFDGWHGVVHAAPGNIAGLFYERGRLGGACAIVAVGLVALPRLWMLLPLVLPALAMTHSRGGWLALIVGLMAVSRHAKWLFGIATFFAVGVAIELTAYDIKLDTSSLERIAMWHDTVVNLTWLGHGLGSFREVFLQTSKFYDYALWGARPEHPHNELLWLAFEGGLPGLVCGVCLGFCLLPAAIGRPERGVLVALLVLACFAMPLHDPATVILGAMCAGHLVGRHALRRSITLGCRDPLCPWMAAVERGNWAQ